MNDVLSQINVEQSNDGKILGASIQDNEEDPPILATNVEDAHHFMKHLKAPGPVNMTLQEIGLLKSILSLTMKAVDLACEDNCKRKY